jgi:hypothetical protein
MGKNNSCYQYIATTGTAVAIGTGAIQFAGVFRSSELAGTLTLLDAGSIILTMSATGQMLLGSNPIALRGPVTMTSSAGRSFVFIFRDM